MSDRQQSLHMRIEGGDLTRLLALSDGLFATVLTILVLDLKLPDIAHLVSQGDIRRVISDLGLHLFSYLLTFIVAGSFWVAHHGDFNHIVRYNRGLLWYNLTFLLFVGLLPFTTAGIGVSGNGGILAWSVYAMNMVAAGGMLALTWGFAYTHRLTDPDMPRRMARYQGLRHLITPGVFLISIGVAFLTPNVFVAPFSLFLIPLLQASLDRRVLGKDTEPAFEGSRAAAVFWRLAFWIPVILLLIAAILAFAAT